MASFLHFLAHTSIFLSAIFIPLLAKDCGLSFLKLGIVCSFYGLLQTFSYYLFGILSDRFGKRKPFIIYGFFSSAFTFILQVFMKDFFTLMLLRGLCGFSIGIFSYPLVAYVAEGEDFREEIAHLSSFGSLGWAAGCLLAGFIKEYEKIFLFSASLFFVGGFLSLSLKERRGFPLNVFAKEVMRRNLLLYLLYFLRHFGAMAIWTVFPIFLRSLGATKQMIGVLYTINAASQVFFMRLCAKVCKKIDERIFIKIGFLSSSLVFFLYTLFKKVEAIFPIQVLLAFSWSTLYIGSLLYLLSRNKEKATATGLLGASISLSTVIGPIFGGFFMEIGNFFFLFLLASLLSLLSWIGAGRL